MEQHEHDFGPLQAKGTVGWCLVEGCNEMRVSTRRGNGRWRELTATETVNVVAYMMEELAMVQAMQMIHGPERGMARYLYLRQGGPSEYA